MEMQVEQKKVKQDPISIQRINTFAMDALTKEIKYEDLAEQEELMREQKEDRELRLKIE